MDEPAFKIWRSDDAVMIRFATGESVELTIDAARALAANLGPVNSPREYKSRNYWSDERKEELRRLYQDERWYLRKIADHFGLKGSKNVNGILRKFGIPPINQPMAERQRARMLEVRSRKKRAA